MIKLLIVDDESATRNGLMRHVDWTGLGVDMVQTAGSAQEGIQISQYFYPDIVLSDIRMRGMTGVEMCSILHEKFPDCQMIFISGYSDKEYYKAAIKIGVVSYIEKPIHIQELQEAISNAIQIILENRKRNSQNLAFQQSMDYIKKEAFLSVIRGEVGEEKWVKIKICEMFKENYAAYRVCIVQASSPITNMIDFSQQMLNKILFPARQCSPALSWEWQFESNDRVIIVLNGDGESIGDKSDLFHRVRDFLQTNQTEMKFFVAVGKPVKEMAEVHKSYEHAVEIEKSVFFKGYNQIVTEQAKTKEWEIAESQYEKFQLGLETTQKQMVMDTLKKICLEIKASESVGSKKIKSIFFRLDQILQSEMQRALGFMDEKKKEEDYHFYELKTADEIQTYLTEKINRFFENKEKEVSGCSAVYQVLRFIDKEYKRKDISVKNIAEEVYLTPTYLSNLFKKKTGKTLGETITEVRIKKSKEILQDKSLKLYHVADMVGYEDANYFAKIFKKRVGITPSEYREQL